MTPTDTLREAVARAIFETWAKATYKHDHPMRWDEALQALAERDKFPKMSVIVPMCRAEADAALSAIEAAGWRIVPVEPTEAMLSAMWSLMCSSGGHGTKACYEALMDAAPRLDATAPQNELSGNSGELPAAVRGEEG